MRARNAPATGCEVSTCENQPAGRRPGCSRCSPPVEGYRSVAGLIGAEDINPRADRPRADRPRAPRPAPIARRPGAHRAGAHRPAPIASSTCTPKDIDRAHTPAHLRANACGPSIDRPAPADFKFSAGADRPARQTSGRTAEKRSHQMPPDARSPADSTRNTCKCSELRRQI